MSTLADSIEAAPVADASVATSSAPRLRPALVNGQAIHVSCPSYCTVDHIAENERHLVDVTHAGEPVDLLIPRQDGSVQLLATARILASDSGTAEERRPMVAVDFEDVQSLYLSSTEADVTADRLEALARQVRALGRVAGGV